MSKTPGRNRRPKNIVTTKSGNTIKINRSLSDRTKARKAGQAAAKATYLATLPKDRFKRILYRLHPKRVARYWFSREGGVMALKIIGISIVIGFFMTIGLFAYFRKDLPKIKDIGGTDLGGSNTYYDRTGQTLLWQDYGKIKRVAVSGDQISPFVKQATVAIEDKDFFKHGAFDVRGIMRAAYHDLSGAAGSVQGGSTITQQLVKLNEQWTSNRTITRKVKELILATELEREYSKNDILTGYLNTAPYGGVDVGVETAARDYFQTSAKDLTLAQATMLAAIPQSPSYYSPYASTRFNSEAGDTFNPGALIGRQHYILGLMVTQHYITKQQADDAMNVDVLAQVHPQASLYGGIKAPYFVLAAKHELEQRFGDTTVKRGGWKILTTVDMNLQTKAEQIVATNLSNVLHRTAGLADEEATVAEDVQTGQIMALVGGTDFNNADHGKINYAASSKIAPGSSFKPYDYVTLIDNNNNVGAGSVLYDTEGKIPGYPCTKKGVLPKDGGDCLKDYDFLQPGPLTLRYALGGSRNIPAVKAMYEAVPNDKSSNNKDSVNKVISTASAMMDNTYLQSKNQSAYNCYQGGIDINNATPNDTTQCYGAAAIGDGAFLHLDDHVNGLATLGRLGQAIPRTYIMQITDAAQKTVYQWKQPQGKQVIKADSAYIVNNMASDPNASYLPGSCSATTCTSLSGGGYKFHRDNGWTFAIKTGTTNSGFDGLMTSWSPKFAVVSWVGNHTRNVDISSRTHTAMEYLTEPLTRGVMEAAHANVKPISWDQPKTIKSDAAFVVRNHVHYGDIEPSPTNDLYPGWYIGGTAKKVSSQIMDKVSGKAATSCTPPLAKDTIYNGNAASWNIDIFSGGKQSISNGTNTGTGSTTPAANDDVHNCNDSPPTISVTAPSSCDASCTITATATQGIHPLTDAQYSQFPGTITFTLGSQTINTKSCSIDEANVCTASFTYTPSASGNDTLTATVTDSVLYSGSSSTPLNFTVPPPPTTPAGGGNGNQGTGTLNLTQTGHTGTNSVFSWTSIGAASYQLCWSGFSTGCAPATSGTSSSTSPLVPGKAYTATVTAKDSSNNTIGTDSKPFIQ